MLLFMCCLSLEVLSASLVCSTQDTPSYLSNKTGFDQISWRCVGFNVSWRRKSSRLCSQHPRESSGRWWGQDSDTGGQDLKWFRENDWCRAVYPDTIVSQGIYSLWVLKYDVAGCVWEEEICSWHEIKLLLLWIHITRHYKFNLTPLALCVHSYLRDIVWQTCLY